METFHEVAKGQESYLRLRLIKETFLKVADGGKLPPSDRGKPWEASQKKKGLPLSVPFSRLLELPRGSGGHSRGMGVRGVVCAASDRSRGHPEDGFAVGSARSCHKEKPSRVGRAG